MLRFFVFDQLFFAGRNVQREPLEKRRQLLFEELMPTMSEIICYSDTLNASAAVVVAAVKEQGLEGVIAKRCNSPYEAGRRSGAWVKMRVNQGQEFVIGGYVPAGGSFDSIIVGYYKGDDLFTLRASGTASLRRCVATCSGSYQHVRQELVRL